MERTASGSRDAPGVPSNRHRASTSRESGQMPSSTQCPYAQRRAAGPVLSHPGGSAASLGCWNEQMERAMGASMSKSFELVLGRKTYEGLRGRLPHSDDHGAEHSTGRPSTWPRRRSTSSSGELEAGRGRAARGRPRAQEKDSPELQVHGSANLIQTLLENQLIDEFRLRVFPARARHGKAPVDPGTAPPAWSS